jgi:hypothetical protein
VAERFQPGGRAMVVCATYDPLLIGLADRELPLQVASPALASRR